MKKQLKFLKLKVIESTFISASFLLILTLSLSFCSNSKPEDTKEIAQEQNEVKFDNAKEEEAKFLVNAAEINLEEIQLGQLAQTKSLNAEVKSLGKMMETAHTKAQSDLQALAEKKQITIPTTLTEEGMSASKKLMDKKARDFDKEYCDKMVSGHKAAINKFEKASTDATDPDIRNWATSILPALRTHLDYSITCQKQFDKM